MQIEHNMFHDTSPNIIYAWCSFWVIVNNQVLSFLQHIVKILAMPQAPFSMHWKPVHHTPWVSELTVCVFTKCLFHTNKEEKTKKEKEKKEKEKKKKERKKGKE